MSTRSTAARTIARSYWLWAGCHLRISYNTRPYDWQAAAFLKIDLLGPPGATLPRNTSRHISLVLRNADKYAADRDYIAYAQRLLGAAVPTVRHRVADRVATPQLPLF